ncbi:MAG: hypothetical protein AAFV54_05700 [Pseudomonadota bacterium]
MDPLYILTHRFGPWHGKRWNDFVNWSGLTQITEIVSLDGLLCAPVLSEVKDNYWPYILNEDFMLDYFTDLDFMLRQVSDTNDKNVLCVFRNPTSHPTPPRGVLKFDFVGYDLIDRQTSISALSNCGGFPKAFSDDELNEFGLLDAREAGLKVQASLVEHYPNESHADCNLWALFRSLSS